MLPKSSIQQTLGVFFQHPTKEFTLKDVSRLSRLAHTSTKQNLTKLIKYGFIHLRKQMKGKRTFPLYKADRSKLFIQYKKISNHMQITESGVIRHIEETLMPKCIVVFGSYQKGEDTEKSGIHLFIEAKKEDVDVQKFEKTLHRKIELHFSEHFTAYPKELKNNIINGSILSGYLETQIMESPQEIIREIEKHKDEMKKFGVKSLVLFGSYAEGTATSQSDLDFLVEYKKGRGLFDDHIHLYQFLEDLFHRKIDLGKSHLLHDAIKKNVKEGKQFAAVI